MVAEELGRVLFGFQRGSRIAAPMVSRFADGHRIREDEEDFLRGLIVVPTQASRSNNLAAGLQ